MLPTDALTDSILHTSALRQDNFKTTAFCPKILIDILLLNLLLNIEFGQFSYNLWFVISLTSGSGNKLDVLDAICRVKVDDGVLTDGTRTPFTIHQPSEQGYLNLTSPLIPPASAKGAEESAKSSDQV